MHTEKSNKSNSIRALFVLISAATLTFSGCINPQSRWSNGGLGIRLAQVEDGIIIKDIAPTFDNPDAALLKGDYIVEVDGQDVTGLPKEAILELISGPVGGTVVVTVLRKKQLITLEIERILQNKAKKRTIYSVTQNETAPPQKKQTDKANTTSAQTAAPTEAPAVPVDVQSEAPDAADADTAPPDGAVETVTNDGETVDSSADSDTESDPSESEPSDDIEADTANSAASKPAAAETRVED